MANKTMHHVIIGDDTYEIVDQYAREHGAEIDALSIHWDLKRRNQ